MWKLNKNNSTINRRHDNGFTLWEVMVAMTVLIIGILSLARLFPLAMKVSIAAEQMTIAINIAQAKVEEILYLGYENIPCDGNLVETKRSLSTDPTNPFYYYQRQIACQYVNGDDLSPATEDTGIKKVTVTVYWDSLILAKEKSRDVIILVNKQ
jgi:Tfp pilus assembly protein PilV